MSEELGVSVMVREGLGVRVELGEEVWLTEALSELLEEELGEPEELCISLML